MPDFDDSPQGEELPSKTEMKRRMTALQELGEALAALPDKQLARMPIEDEQLRTAIQEVRNIRSNSARRRHMQYIGKLMRGIDPQPMQRALDDLRGQQRQATDAFHALEKMRDRLLEGGPAAIEDALQQWPMADRQQLRQLVLQHQREAKQGRPPSASRRLFKYLRQLQEG